MTIDLETASKKFAQEVEDLLEGVLPRGGEDTDELRIRTFKQGRRYVIRTGTEEKAGGIALYAQQR